jgi:hypothetical protein
MAVLMLLAFVLVLVFVRDPFAMPMIFSGMPLARLLDKLIYAPLAGMVASPNRLEAAIWVIIVAAWLQWTLLGALLAYLWNSLRYRRSLPNSTHEA